MGEPWGRFSFADDFLCEQLAEVIEWERIDLLVAGPIRRLGLEGGGTPEQVVAYGQLVSNLRGRLTRPLAVEAIHHTNKAGSVSGAFGPEPDTLLGVRHAEKHRTLIEWEKTRWSSATHGKRQTLEWIVECEGFKVVDSEVPDDVERKQAAEFDALAWIAAYVAEHPGTPRGQVEKAYQEAHDSRGRGLARRAIDRALAETLGETPHALAIGPGETKHGKYLYPASHALSPPAAPPNGETHETGPAPAREPLLAVSPPTYREDGEWREGGESDLDGGGNIAPEDVERLAVVSIAAQAEYEREKPK